MGSLLGKPLGSAGDYGESWEIADLPGWESVVDAGPLAGVSIRELMQRHREDLLGRQHRFERFPLLLKFIDARRDLSVQVHPRPERRTGGSGRIVGKTELWVVLQALPGSRMLIGLRPGVDETDLRRAIAAGRMEDCLKAHQPQPGDCILVEPGTVHALGSGILIAEVQQPCDVTYRLYDWRRVDDRGNARELHVEQALQAIDFSAEPIHPILPARLAAEGSPEELLDNRNFVVHRYCDPGGFAFPEDDRAHVLTVLAGIVTGGEADSFTLRLGQTLLLPARRTPLSLHLAPGTTLLDAFVR